jgi:hypothetical protein
MIAIYRITHDDWTSERAKAEAKKYGMHSWEMAMKLDTHDFYHRRQRLKSNEADTTVRKIAWSLCVQSR